MAYDKVVDSAVLNAGLTQIANAIREKSGTGDVLAFPTGMAEAIAALADGGMGIPGYDIAFGSFTPAVKTPKPTVDTGWGNAPDASKKYAVTVFGWQPSGVENNFRTISATTIYNANINGTMETVHAYSYANTTATNVSSGASATANEKSTFESDGTITLCGYSSGWAFAVGHVYVWFAIREKQVI